MCSIEPLKFFWIWVMDWNFIGMLLHRSSGETSIHRIWSFIRRLRFSHLSCIRLFTLLYRAFFCYDFFTWGLVPFFSKRLDTGPFKFSQSTSNGKWENVTLLCDLRYHNKLRNLQSFSRKIKSPDDDAHCAQWIWITRSTLTRLLRDTLCTFKNIEFQEHVRWS